jgi:gluconokinase
VRVHGQREMVQIVIVMGVSGAGKTVVGRALAAALGWRFIDADDYHSAANIQKMHHGIALTDADRAPWLATLRELLRVAAARGERVVLACSALKQSYRAELHPDNVPASAEQLVYLDVPVNVLQERLSHRLGHFAPPELLASQLATLEKPADALWVDGTKPVAEIVDAIRAALEI